MARRPPKSVRAGLPEPLEPLEAKAEVPPEPLEAPVLELPQAPLEAEAPLEPPAQAGGPCPS